MSADNVTPILEGLEADIPVFVESDVSVSQVVRALRSAALSMRLDPYKGIIISRLPATRPDLFSGNTNGVH